MRLKELEQIGLIEKNILSKIPVSIQYDLSLRGMALNKVIYEISVFSIEQLTEEVINDNPESFQPAKREVSIRFGLEVIVD